MPFLTLYTERKVLSGLGYTSSMDDLDCVSACCLLNIEAEIRKQEKEEQDKKIKKGGKKRG
jgi:hypothetical protein